MGVYLVTFESPARDYRRYHEFVGRFDAMRLSDTAWAVQSDLGADQLYRELEPLVGKDDHAYVITLNKPWIGYGYEAMNDWLERHL
jgi:hypothetical protein